MDTLFTESTTRATTNLQARKATCRASATSLETARTISRVSVENRLKKRFLYGFSMGGTVVLQLHRKDPLYWDGAVLLAPMCKGYCILTANSSVEGAQDEV
ncbi:hypothetical protein Zm00014a_007987 [Zea mays]|uniref:Serine aminopeptidase S33 domain-containing protein n=1 Tax=Zea mays TaxID=4577 RepID=A0A3L6DDQ0_MAIZE|nr:hypothetical protein Zm00014a_007987 [Zea mays]